MILDPLAYHEVQYHYSAHIWATLKELAQLHIESSLSCIIKKATIRLYFLKQLKRAGLPSFTLQLSDLFLNTVHQYGTMGSHKPRHGN